MVRNSSLVQEYRSQKLHRQIKLRYGDEIRTYEDQTRELEEKADRVRQKLRQIKERRQFNEDVSDTYLRIFNRNEELKRNGHSYPSSFISSSAFDSVMIALILN